jgi:hypothetical protein
MAQTNLGTVTVTHGATLVTGDANCDWTGFQAGTIVFWISGTNASYSVGAVRTPAQNVSGFWELNLVANYGGATEVGAPFVLTNSFSPILNLPLLSYGDAQGNVIFSRAILLIENILVGLQAAAGVKIGTGATPNVKIDGNGNLMVLNTTTGTYQYLIFQGAAGASALVGVDTYP